MGIAPLLCNEYTWAKRLAAKIQEVAPQSIEVDIFLRDNIGIRACYRNVAEWVRGADKAAAVELHFNSYNSRARGAETLYGRRNLFSPKWAKLLQGHICAGLNLSSAHNRGVKHRAANERGGTNVNALSCVPTALIEPGFGDNYADAKLLAEHMDELARAVVNAFRDFSHTT